MMSQMDDGSGGEARPSPEDREPDVRFSYANERTFLAWIRTALALMTAGLAITQLLPPFDSRVDAASSDSRSSRSAWSSRHCGGRQLTEFEEERPQPGLAAERTDLAWNRSGLALAASGVAIMRGLALPGLSSAHVAVGAVVLVLGAQCGRSGLCRRDDAHVSVTHGSGPTRATSYRSRSERRRLASPRSSSVRSSRAEVTL